MCVRAVLSVAVAASQGMHAWLVIVAADWAVHKLLSLFMQGSTAQSAIGPEQKRSHYPERVNDLCWR